MIHALLAAIQFTVPAGTARAVLAGQADTVELVGIVDAVASSDGNLLFVLDGGPPYLRALGRNGQVLAAFAGRGQGPGEVTQPGWIGWVDRRLCVVDRPYRAHCFHADGRLDWTRAASSLVEQRVRHLVGGLTRDGGLVLFRRERPVGPIRQDGVQHPIEILTGGLPSGETRRIALVESTVRELRVPFTVLGQRGTAVRPEPLGDDPLFRLDRTGSSLVVVGRRSASRPGAAEFEVTRLTMSGDTVFSRRFAYRARAVDQAFVDRVVEETRQAIRLQRRSQPVVVEVAAVAKQLYLPATIPPVSGLVVGGDSTIWLAGWNGEHLVLSASGRPLMLVAIPPGERVVEAFGERVWTASEGPDGSPVLKWYRVRRP